MQPRMRPLPFLRGESADLSCFTNTNCGRLLFGLRESNSYHVMNLNGCCFDATTTSSLYFVCRCRLTVQALPFFPDRCQSSTCSRMIVESLVLGAAHQWLTIIQL